VVPFLDRGTVWGHTSRLFTWVGVLILAYVIVLTYLGYTASPMS